MAIQTDNLISYNQAAAKLAVCRATFFKILPQLRAKGMKVIEIKSPSSGQNMKRISALSLDKVIARAAEHEEVI